jgi:hypothetical protein
MPRGSWHWEGRCHRSSTSASVAAACEARAAAKRQQRDAIEESRVADRHANRKHGEHEYPRLRRETIERGARLNHAADHPQGDKAERCHGLGQRFRRKQNGGRQEREQRAPTCRRQPSGDGGPEQQRHQLGAMPVA